MILQCDQLNAQAPAAFVRKADEAADAGDWQLAFGYYQQAYEIDTSDFSVRSGYALAAFHIKKYDIASQIFVANYARDNGAIDPDALFWIASIEKLNGRYEDAQRNFRKYIKKHKSSASRDLIEKAEHEVKSAVWALEHNDDRSSASPLKKLMPGEDWSCEVRALQSSFMSETAGAPFLDGDRLYYSYHADGQWRVVSGAFSQSMNSVVGNEERLSFREVGFESISNPCVFDNHLYFSAERNDGVVICVAEKSADGWNGAREMEIINEAGAVSTMPFVGKIDDRTVMIFSSDREGGEGGMDLWISELNGTWSKPKSAGKQVNTPGNEIAPSVFQGQLFFSSDWHNGFGGHDIFMAKAEGKGFTSPENCGKAVNSSFNDIGFAMKSSDDHAGIIFASNRKTEQNDNESCCNRLYVLDCNREFSADTAGKKIQVTEDLIRTLPVVLYFHNDEPDPRTLDTTTRLSYSQSYEAYLKLLPKYIDENTKGLNGERREDAETMTRDFFELKVKAGMTDLHEFSAFVLRELEAGKSLLVSVQGFASPRAESNYNLNLTKRRTASLVNEMLADSNGIFRPYIEGTAANGAQLRFTLLPFGEYEADASVSDDLKDERNSIYSRAACLERKIEITRVEYFVPQAKDEGLILNSDSHDFGKIPWFGEVTHDFELLNGGNEIMIIDSVIAECGCTNPVIEKSVLQPGESTKLHVGFNPISKEGIQEKQVLIYVQGEEPKVVRIRAERSR
jgi:hypothetical protein